MLRRRQDSSITKMIGAGGALRPIAGMERDPARADATPLAGGLAGFCGGLNSNYAGGSDD